MYDTKNIFSFKYNATEGNVFLSSVLKRLHALVSDYQLNHRNHACTLGLPAEGHGCTIGLPVGGYGCIIGFPVGGHGCTIGLPIVFGHR